MTHAGYVFREWAQDDAPSAAAFALNLPAGDNRGEALRAVARRWMEREASGFEAWKETLTPKDRALLPQDRR